MPPPLLVTFAAGDEGQWRMTRADAVIGETLPASARLAVSEGAAAETSSAWVLRGATSNQRYTTREEAGALVARQEALGRPLATCAALIPIRKSESWWALAQDERRAILEERSRHIAIGLEVLPGVARRLHHCRDLVQGEREPFDFLTWFEYAPEHEAAFEAMVAKLRASEEWRYVEREVDVRLRRG